MKFQQFILAFLLSKLANAASCSGTIITSQSDADVVVTACPTVTGDVLLATNAAGSINLDGIQVINGNLASESCSNCANFSSLSGSTLVSVSQNISLQNLPNLGNITFPHLQTVGDQFYLDSLPLLSTLSIPTLSSVGQFHLGSATNLKSMNLTQLRNVTDQNPSIELISVGLSSLANLDTHMNLSSLILRDNSYIQELNLSSSEIGYLEITNSRNAPTVVDVSSIAVISTFNMSGCQGLVADSATTFDTLFLSQNIFSHLSLQYVKVVSNLSIVDHSNLNQTLLPANMSIQNIEITGNVALEGSQLSGGTEPWPWGITNISSMILSGLFEPRFFQEYKNLTLVEISKEFSLTSYDLSFDCSSLNTLRTRGYFQGSYSCQDKTVAAGPVRTSSGPPNTSPLSLSLIAAMLCSIASLML